MKKLAAPFGGVWPHLREVGGLEGPEGITLEGFRVELAELGLLGRPFGPDEYRAALEGSLEIEILVEEIQDTAGALASSLEGNLAEVAYLEGRTQAVILVSESLRMRPWPAYELSLFHELSHLAAGHPSKARRVLEGRGGTAGVLRFFMRSLPALEPGCPQENLEWLKENVFEPEARKRAKWLVFAGRCPRAFEAESADLLT